MGNSRISGLNMSIARLLFVLALLSPVVSGCDEKKEGRIQMYKKYHVPKAMKDRVKLDGLWHSDFWADVTAVELTNYIINEPEHKPKTQAKVTYDDKYLYVIFRVEDKYVRAVAQNHQDMVCWDSCVEFFFTPGPDISVGYFNVEVNCGGTMLFRYQLIPWKDAVNVSPADLEQVQIFHSEHKIVDPEKQQPTTWVIEYRLPFDVLEKYCEFVRPAPGVVWRANFYKCADQTSQPHWLNWSAIDKSAEAGGFHTPKFFGTLEFE